MTKDTSFKDTVLFILGVFLASFVIQSFLYPDLCFYLTRRLGTSHETQIPLESTFILVSHFFHGGIQLWDRFDQMNNAFFVSINGIYGVANIITAFIFIIFSPFFSHPAEALYHTHLFLFYGLTSFIRTIGGYLLLRKLISNKAVIFICLLYLNTILTSYMMTQGLMAHGVYCFLPLVLYFIFCFFEDLRLRTFLSAALVMALCLISSPYLTFGYFYQAVHFFILSCAGNFLLRREWHKLRQRPPLPKAELFKNIGLAACCSLIILPYYWWGHALSHDFYVHGSGLGGSEGRFNNIFNLKEYFNIFGKGFANSFEFLGTALDYHHNVGGTTWLFIGASTLFLALAGVVLSKDRRKYIFVAAIFFMILINNAWFPGNFSVLEQDIKYADNNSLFWAKGLHPNDWLSYGFLMISTIAHGINALTNPFCFLVRSFHMASLLVPMMFLPLVAMGLESYLYLWQRKVDSIHFNRRWFLVLFYASVLLWALLGGTQTLSVGLIGQGAAQTLKEYILSTGTIFFFFTLMPELISADKKWVGWVILGFAFAVDFVGLMLYVRIYDKSYPDNAVPTRLNPCYTHQAVVPDYQNPRVLPFREFLNVEDTNIYPVINGGPLCMFGAFYQYTPISRFFHPWSIYEPRHISYKNLYPDLEIQQYLTGNQRIIFFADYAFDSRYIRLADILRLNLGQRVVMVDPEGYNRPFLKTAERVYISPMNFEDKFYNVSLDWSKAEIHKSPSGWEYTFELPKDFPFYLSTTVFTNDYTSWKLMVGNRLLSPMQGKLTAPFTYDVQNIQDKKLTILWPDERVPQRDIKLQVKLPERVLNVWKNTYDDLGLTYEAPKAGWLVFNYPYDEKWELTIDGRKTPLSKVNRYFMGAPISGGQHQILLRYWPHTSLRFWIFISMVLSCICFFGIIFYSVQREPLYRAKMLRS